MSDTTLNPDQTILTPTGHDPQTESQAGQADAQQDAQPAGNEQAKRPSPADMPQHKPAQQNTKTDAASGDAKTVSELRRARDDAAKYRVRLRETEEANQKLVETIGRQLGLITEEDAKPTVEDLASQLKQREAAQARTELEFKVYKTAVKTGADPERLLDSRAFMESLENVDANSLEDHVKTYVADHSYLKAQPQGGTSAIDTTARRGITPEQFNRMTYREKEKLYTENRAEYEALINRM